MRSLARHLLPAALLPALLLAPGCTTDAVPAQAVTEKTEAESVAETDAAEPEEAEPTPDTPATAQIRVVDFDGVRKLLRERGDKPLLVNFWAMWCAPCIGEMPDFLAATESLPAEGGEAILVAMDLMARGQELDDVLAKLPKFLADRGWQLPVLVYDDDPERLRELEIPGLLPSTLVVSATGETLEVHEGVGTRAEFDAMVEHALR